MVDSKAAILKTEEILGKKASVVTFYHLAFLLMIYVFVCFFVLFYFFGFFWFVFYFPTVKIERNKGPVSPSGLAYAITVKQTSAKVKATSDLFLTLLFCVITVNWIDWQLVTSS